MGKEYIQLPIKYLVQTSLLIDAIEQLLWDDTLDDDIQLILIQKVKEVSKYLKKQNEAKIAKMNVRAAYIAYRNATGKERETLRKEYLDMASINKDWRTDTEQKI